MRRPIAFTRSTKVQHSPSGAESKGQRRVPSWLARVQGNLWDPVEPRSGTGFAAKSATTVLSRMFVTRQSRSFLHPGPIPRPARGPEGLRVGGVCFGAREPLFGDPLRVAIAEVLVVAR